MSCVNTVSSNVVSLSDTDFEKSVIQSDRPVLVEFWAEWCAPCGMLTPTLERLVEDYEDKILIGRLNVDYNSLTAKKYEIQGIPAMLLFKDGQLVQKIIGLKPHAVISQMIDEHL